MARILGLVVVRPALTAYLTFVVLYTRNPRRRRDAKELLHLLTTKDR